MVTWEIGYFEIGHFGIKITWKFSKWSLFRNDLFGSYPFRKWPISQVTDFRNNLFTKILISESSYFRSELFPKWSIFRGNRFRTDPFFIGPFSAVLTIPEQIKFSKWLVFKLTYSWTYTFFEVTYFRIGLILSWYIIRSDQFSEVTYFDKWTRKFRCDLFPKMTFFRIDAVP